MNNGRKFYYISVIAALVLIITYLHYSTIHRIHALHDFYKELYYIPLLIGALAFGLKGAIYTYLLISVLYIPHIAESWTDDIWYNANRLLHLIFSAVFTFVAGFLVDRDKRQRREVERNRYLAAVGQFAAGIVHDLKNPLFAIIGFTKRIREGKGDANAVAETLVEAALTMQRIVLEVLDFAKPFHLNLKEEDMRSIVARACDASRIRAEEEGVALTLKLPAADMKCMMDGVQMQRALANLINNAIDVSPSGQAVDVRVLGEKEAVTVEIKDNGPGMDRETLENVFIPFYTKKKAGTGLGMSIAKKIVDEHKGKIRITSQHGKGTKVTVEVLRRPEIAA
ncbi:MAG: HAMP domain-containing sensor histidine kinase [Nitrospirota bacterium]